MNAFQPELFIPNEGADLKLLKDTAIQVAGYLRNLLPGPATVVLLIKPASDQYLIIKSVSLGVKEPEMKRVEDNYSCPSTKKENVGLTHLTIKVIRENSDGVEADMLTI